jgi:hypothetical protein
MYFFKERVRKRVDFATDRRTDLVNSSLGGLLSHITTTDLAVRRFIGRKISVVPTIKPIVSFVQLGLSCCAICKPLGNFYSVLLNLVAKEMPNSEATCTGEESELPVALPATPEIKHPWWVG